MNNAYINGYLEGYLEKRAGWFDWFRKKKEIPDYNPIPRHFRNKELGRLAGEPDSVAYYVDNVPMRENQSSANLAKQLYAEHYPSNQPLPHIKPARFPRYQSALERDIIPLKNRTAEQEDLADTLQYYDMLRREFPAEESIERLRKGGFGTTDSVDKLKELIAKGLIMANRGGTRNPGV